ncbi:MAG TPA: MaoC family dehydratase [Saprospiraceae bacterium]|nr:enoyl-CoA hydratase [Saprospirales bacterium]HRQ29596.1 MaoC family dehydratase [Saprospiraceae bacterium]
MIELIIGQEASISKSFSDKDVELFTKLSLDNNPVHLEDDFAAQTIFKKRIVHGYLYGSLISAVLGTKLPGPGSIYLHQEMNFKKPVYLNENVTATVKVTDINHEKSLIYLDTFCTKNDDKQIVLAGKAIIKLV